MSEEKKKLGVEDLVQAQRETAEQLKVISERLDWIVDAESGSYNYGCGWIWWTFVLFAVAGIGGSIANKTPEPILGLIAFCLLLQIGLNLRDANKTPRQQCRDRWADEQYRKKEEAMMEERTKKYEARIAAKEQARKQKLAASRTKIEIKKDS